jgi:hypothetical protein
MKNLISFYVIILAPLGILFWLNTSDLISENLFVVLLVFYVLVYRTYTDGKRLVNKNLISEKDIWKMAIPESRFKYFKELYLR